MKKSTHVDSRTTLAQALLWPAAKFIAYDDYCDLNYQDFNFTHEERMATGVLWLHLTGGRATV